MEREGKRADPDREERESVERALEERAREVKRQDGGSTPTEDVLERALEVEPGVEWHAGEDAGEVPDRDE
jgi:hypothetical protein